MRNKLTQGSLLVATGLLVAVGLAAAQEAPKAASTPRETQAVPASVYRMDIVVRELEDGKRINSRSYSLSGTPHGGASLRVGSKVPTGYMESDGQKGIQYRDVGINIDCQPEERENSILLFTRFESSSVVTPEKETEGGGNPYVGPVIRQVKFDGRSPVTEGKPTVIATLDDVATARRYEIEVTVTKMK